MLVEIINNIVNREKCYNDGKQYVKKFTGSTKNACASVASSYLINAGYDIKRTLNTKSLCLQLLQNYESEIILFVEDIKAGDILFSSDLAGMYMPDHVCICHHIEGKRIFVLDNYSINSHERNMRAGKRTPFAFGLRVEQKNKGEMK